MRTDRGPMDVWLYGTRLATLCLVGDRIRWTWGSAAIARWGRGARLVCELPPDRAAR